MVNCLFCQIISGELDSVVFYEDALTVGIMDLRQPDWPNATHVLVIPREHVEQVYELTDTTSAALMASVVKAARSLRRVASPAGMSIWQSNGAAAGQEIPHVHMHLLTRREDDDLLRIYPTAPLRPAAAELESMADRLRQELALP